METNESILLQLRNICIDITQKWQSSSSDIKKNIFTENFEKCNVNTLSIKASFMTNLPASLIAAFRAKKLVPLVGAGVSMSVTDNSGKSIFPSWQELLRRAAETLRTEGKEADADAIEVMITKKKYKYAADFAREGLIGGLWSKFFKENFQIDKEKISPQSLELAEAIWTLGNRVITLNYDTVLHFSSSTSAVFSAFDNSAKVELADFSKNSSDAQLLWHLHGKIDNVAQIIFTSEGYNKLYAEKESTYKAAIEVFRNVCRDEIIFFVGCSLDDADILQQISTEFDLFSGNVGPHYALVHATQIEDIRRKIQGLPIELISFPEYGEELIKKIKSITQIDIHYKSKISNLAKSHSSVFSKQDTRIAFLSAHPLTGEYECDDLIKEIKKLKCTIYHYPLTIKNLNELDNFNYIFISSQIVKNKITIEDDALGGHRLSLMDLEENIGCSDIDGVFIFSDSDLSELKSSNDLYNTKFPTIVFPTIEKINFSSLFFKIFRKNDLDHIKEALISNKDKFNVYPLDSDPIFITEKSPLSENIDIKTIKNYVGRNTDLQNLSRKIIDLKHENEILTIKGSGGIGKTLTIKKIAYEFSKRNYFSDGIYFIDCESIPNYKNFEFSIAACFNAESFPNPKKYIRDNFQKTDRLVILDNVETLLYIEDCILIKELVGFFSDYCTIVLTSRELLELSYEQKYELRQFTTDEAYALFVSELDDKITSDQDKKIVREDIIENLLDNNPLAIKLITKNIPKGKSFRALKQELENDIFRKISDSEILEFDSLSDTNIEKRKSLYASINFSYQYLNEKEKMAFELLSLFPDGINIENLKRISEDHRLELNNSGKDRPPSPKDFIITDPVIRSLDNKSMIQINNKMIKLQSIVGKFSDKKFKSRDEVTKNRFHRNAFDYNSFFARLLREKIPGESYIAAKLFNSHEMNFFKSISYIDQNISSELYIDYLDDVDFLSRSTGASKQFLLFLEKNHFLSNLDGIDEKCLSAIKLCSQYYQGEFSTSISKMREIAPVSWLKEIDFSPLVNKILLNSAFHLYNLEGECLDAAINYDRKAYFGSRYPASLFFLGELNLDLANTCICDFIKIEVLCNLGKLNLETVDAYIESQYEKEFLETLQCYYVKSKITTVSKYTIKKLVATNPYAEGLKSLMYAFIENDFDKKYNLFLSALGNLSHIKYYYCEALFFFSDFLYRNGHFEFDSTISEGIEICRKYNFRHILFRLESIENNIIEEYDVRSYPLPFNEDFNLYILNLTKNNLRKPTKRNQTPRKSNFLSTKSIKSK